MKKNDKPFKRYASDGIHEKVMEIMERLPKGLVLDIPAGQGALSSDLEKSGNCVVPGDLEAVNILYRNRRAAQLDLNQFLPFREGAFDHVVCIEGIEHIENPHQLARECARVLKKVGYLVISTPNVMTIKSRLRFLFYHYLDFFKYFGPIPAGAKHRIEENDQFHINPVFYGEMKYLPEKAGFTIVAVETNRKVRRGGFLYSLIKWFVKKKTGKRFAFDPLYLSDTLLEGEDLIFVARR